MRRPRPLGALRARAGFMRRRRERRERAWNPPPINEANVAISQDMGSDSPVLLIAFGGLNMQIGVPPFEFLSLTGAMPVKKLFVRDLRQAWYHRGIPGYGETLRESAAGLGELIAGQRSQRLVVAGASAGGYAALAYGTLLGADEALCFCPQTMIDLDALAAIDDHRWDDHLEPVFARGEVDPAWTDLRVALQRESHERTLYRVFFDENLPTDRAHAEHLAGVQGVRLHRFGRGEHYLVRQMRNSGALAHVLQRALAGQGAADATTEDSRAG